MGRHINGYFREYAAINRERLTCVSREGQKKRLANGRCSSCALERMATSTQWCRKHWFISVAKNNLGSATVDDGEFLERLQVQVASWLSSFLFLALIAR